MGEHVAADGRRIVKSQGFPADHRQRPLLLSAHSSADCVKNCCGAQRIASECSLPIIYRRFRRVFLALQEEIFPDEDDFG